MGDRCDEAAQQKYYDGVWIGIDLGTSNSTCAVWDSSRGGSKWIRMNEITDSDGSKPGRIMPSVVRFRNATDDPVVGYPALKESSSPVTTMDTNQRRSGLFRSVKRLLGKRYEDLDPSWIATLDFDIVPCSKGSFGDETHSDDGLSNIQLIATAESDTGSPTKIITTPEEILAFELKAIREASQAYLDRYRVSKNLQVPCGRENSKSTDSTSTKIKHLVNNVVVGVPANFSQRQIQLIKRACVVAGFEGFVGTCLESTAAAVAYGLTLQERSQMPPLKNDKTPKKGNPTIMVVDMGGGTTDITIATSRKNLGITSSPYTTEDRDLSSSYQVLVTRGDDRLGGDDIDGLMMEYCLGKLIDGRENEVDESKIRCDAVKVGCRKAKEGLCQKNDPEGSERVFVDFLDHCSQAQSYVEITQEIFDTNIMKPWLRRAKALIEQTRDDLGKTSTPTGEIISIDEVVLVGGTTRIPVIRRLIRDIFPEIEISLSLNPMSSVSQGLAIQAAIASKQIPMHELKSAMMLDCVPHAIGVQLCLPDGNEKTGGFVEIIPRNALLPAAGSANFTLANKLQSGVTVRAVEEIGPEKYEPIRNEDFTFVLRKLTTFQLEQMTSRTIQVGMKLDMDGRFIVSVFDENDPEQVRKKDRFEKAMNEKKTVGDLEYIKDMMLADSDDISNEQIRLIVALVSTVILYIAVKVAFTDPLEGGSSILG